VNTLHTPPLQAQWQAALAATLHTVLHVLDKLPVAEGIAKRLFETATRLAGPAAAALQAAAEGAEAAVVLEQSPAIALSHALQSYMDLAVEHANSCRLAQAHARSNDIGFVMVPMRAAESALRALATAMVTLYSDACQSGGCTCQQVACCAMASCTSCCRSSVQVS
jgi:hypothetical protein